MRPALVLSGIVVGALVVLFVLQNAIRPAGDQSGPVIAIVKPKERPNDPKKFGGIENAVANPDFERDAAYWTPWRDSIAAVVSITHSAHRFGHGALEVTAGALDTFGVSTQVIGSPNVGSVYALSFWVTTKTSPGKQLTASVLGFGDAGGRPDVLAQRQIELSRTWTHVVFRVPVYLPGIQTLDIYFWRLSSITLAESFLIDGVDFVQTH